jgi:hypothetical protein
MPHPLPTNTLINKLHINNPIQQKQPHTIQMFPPIRLYLIELLRPNLRLQLSLLIIIKLQAHRIQPEILAGGEAKEETVGKGDVAADDGRDLWLDLDEVVEGVA